MTMKKGSVTQSVSVNHKFTISRSLNQILPDCRPNFMEPPYILFNKINPKNEQITSHQLVNHFLNKQKKIYIFFVFQFQIKEIKKSRK